MRTCGPMGPTVPPVHLRGTVGCAFRGSENCNGWRRCWRGSARWRQGKVGIGFGKAKEVPSAVEKALKDAKRKMTAVCLKGNSIPHEIIGRYRSSRVVMLPASQGTGVIAGASARAVLECVGVQNILTKL